jgi:hypothetical protein
MESTAALDNQLLAKGRLGQREVLGGPDMLGLEAAERESGMNRQLLCELEATGRLLALNLLPAVSDLRFPRWQFEQPVLEAMPTILKSFGAGVNGAVFPQKSGVDRLSVGDTRIGDFGFDCRAYLCRFCGLLPAGLPADGLRSKLSSGRRARQGLGVKVR